MNEKMLVKQREQVIKDFIEREDHFYTITDGTVPQWKIPTAAPTILLCKCLFFSLNLKTRRYVVFSFLFCRS
jgi:hypothetical protein